MNVKKTDSWLDAFLLLEKYLQKIDDGSRQLVFLDELPWLDTARSGFITAFEGFWNNWGCHRKFILMPSLLAWSDKERCRLLGIRILNCPEYSAMSSEVRHITHLYARSLNSLQYTDGREDSCKRQKAVRDRYGGSDQP